STLCRGDRGVRASPRSGRGDRIDRCSSRRPRAGRSRVRSGCGAADSSPDALVISQGEIWWANLGEPRNSEPDFSRPVVVVQGDSFNRSRLATVVCVTLTSNARYASFPGNVSLPAKATGLDRDSVALVTQVVTLDRSQLSARVGRLAPAA